MSLENYKLTYETLENEKKIWRSKKTEGQQFKADQSARLGNMVREVGHSLKSNIIRRIKGDNAK